MPRYRNAMVAALAAVTLVAVAALSTLGTPAPGTVLAADESLEGTPTPTATPSRTPAWDSAPSLFIDPPPNAHIVVNGVVDGLPTGRVGHRYRMPNALPATPSDDEFTLPHAIPEDGVRDGNVVHRMPVLPSEDCDAAIEALESKLRP